LIRIFFGLCLLFLSTRTVHSWCIKTS
jgi:hypothetical protein